MSIDEPANWPAEDETLAVVSTEVPDESAATAAAGDDRFPEDLYPSELPPGAQKVRGLVMVGFVIAVALVAFVVGRLVSNRVGTTVESYDPNKPKTQIPVDVRVPATQYTSTVDRCTVTDDQFVEISGTITNKTSFAGPMEVAVQFVEAIGDVKADPRIDSDYLQINAFGTEDWDIRLRGMSNGIDGAEPSTVTGCKVVWANRTLDVSGLATTTTTTTTTTTAAGAGNASTTVTTGG